jgi:hypothetical protein
MIDSIIEETLFIVKNLDDKLQKIAEKQQKLNEKMEELEHTKTKTKKKLFPVTDIQIK